MLHIRIALALGLMFTAAPVLTHAADDSDANGMSLIVKTTNRTIKTDEKRWSSPDGRTLGSFDQLVKGNGTPEDLKQTGPYAKDDDKEVYTLRETGVTETGKRVDNGLVITRDFVGGQLQEILRRTPKQKAETKEEKQELLGGLPGVVQTTFKPDGSRTVNSWNNPDADPKTPPDDTFEVDDGGGRRPPVKHGNLDDFVKLHIKIKDKDDTPPDGGKGPGAGLGVDVDKITVITAPPVVGPAAPPVINPPVTPPTPPPTTRTGSFSP